MINLAGILYAALTGRWPGVARSAVPTGTARGAVARCARARCAPACPAPSTRSASGCCTRRPRSTRCRSRRPTRSRPPWPTTSATPASAAPLDAAGDARRADGLDPPRRAARPSADLQPDADPPRPSRHRRGRRADPRRPSGRRRRSRRAEPAEADAAPAVDELGGRPQLYREPLEDPTSLAPLHAPRRGGRTAAAVRGPPRAAAVRHHRAPGPGGAPGQPVRGTGHRRRGSTGATGRHLRPASRGGRPASGGDAATPARSGFWPFTDEPRRPATRSTPARRAAAGCGWRSWSACSSCSWWPWRSPSTAVARTATTADTGSQRATRAAAAQGQGVAGRDRRRTRLRPARPTRRRRTPTTADNAIDGDPRHLVETQHLPRQPRAGRPQARRRADARPRQGPARPASVTVRFKGEPTSFEVYAAPAGVTEPPDSLDQLDKVGVEGRRPERGDRAARPDTDDALPARLADQAAAGRRAASGARSPTSRSGREPAGRP